MHFSLDLINRSELTLAFLLPKTRHTKYTLVRVKHGDTVMCRFIVTYHEFSECRLREAMSDGRPNFILAFFMSVLPSPQMNGLGDSVEPRIHTVQQKSIFQCSVARDDPNLARTASDRRACVNPIPAQPNMNRVQSAGVTRETGECPVCTAILRITEEETKQEIIVNNIFI